MGGDSKKPFYSRNWAFWSGRRQAGRPPIISVQASSCFFPLPLLSRAFCQFKSLFTSFSLLPMQLTSRFPPHFSSLLYSSSPLLSTPSSLKHSKKKKRIRKIHFPPHFEWGWQWWFVHCIVHFRNVQIQPTAASPTKCKIVGTLFRFPAALSQKNYFQDL